ncbi:MAG: hypothetical protein SFU98_14600 [Leptospiraceae bacterium]|nr:hypothetical protein [Leptospiraceae bacterium]
MLNIKAIMEKGFKLRVVWDLFMVFIVLANLLLIVFDLTYLWLRPIYFEHYKKATEVYDPILGIEPHRVTQDYTNYVKELSRIEVYKNESELYQALNSQLKSIVESLERLEKEKPNESISKINLNIKKLIDNKKENEQVPFIVLEILFKEALEIEKETLSTKEYNSISNSIDEYSRLLKMRTIEGYAEVIESIFRKMDQQMVMLVEENPFKESGQTYLFKEIQTTIKELYGKNSNHIIDERFTTLLTKEGYTRRKVPSTAIAFAWFWRNDSTTLKEKLDFFNENLRLKFDTNYFRMIDKKGNYVNEFYKLDAPFFTFFFIEFLTSWYLSIRRKEFIVWFFYPIYHWYDILGLIPLAEFRIFRLIRVYKIYLILERSEYTTLGNDIISRTLRYYSNIIKEELSDMVTIQILTDSQEEIRSGSSMEVLTNAIDAHRSEIKSILLKQLSNPGTINRMKKLSEEVIPLILEDKATIFPTEMKEKLARELALLIFRIIQDSANNLANSESGKASIEKLIDFVLDELVASAKDPELNKLNQMITIDLLENVKNQVRVKKWVNTEI